MFIASKKKLLINEREFEEYKSSSKIEEHFKCYRYKELKDEWDKAIESGNKKSCPNGHNGGIKNVDSGTHMAGSHCNTSWCYIGGLSEKDCDKSNSNGSLYQHNDDWETNSKRGPMYFSRINKIDKRWKSNDNEWNLQFFHKLLTYKNIRDFINKHGMKKFKELCKVFSTVREHGYDLKEAMQMDLTLIKR